MSGGFNIYLLNVNKARVGRLRPTTVLDTFDGMSKDFHQDGLYSTLTFGSLGSNRRLSQFSYIDLGTEIISPAVALALFDLKELYKDIMKGTRYATWDPATCDFEPAQPADPGASTGYSFFLSKYKELKPKRNKSISRQQAIDVFEKYRDIALSRYVLVLPAGLRDLDVKEGVREQEHEINPLYRKLIASSRVIPENSRGNTDALDSTKWTLQNTFNEIYGMLFDIFDGKKGYIRGKWASRRVTNGTRNVLSSMRASSPILGRADQVSPFDTVCGIFQYMKGLVPVMQHAIRTKYLAQCVGPAGSLYLIDKKTLKRQVVPVRPEDYVKYTTDEGIAKIIESFRDFDIRHEEVQIQGHYLALIYNDGKTFKVFYDIDDLPKHLDRKYVKPITLAELLYSSIYHTSGKYYGILTRFPVAGPGSSYVTSVRLTTTARTAFMKELTDDWTTTHEIPATDFPLRECEEFFSTMSPHPSRLSGLAADFDGDTGSLEFLYSNESLAESAKNRYKAVTWIKSDTALNVDPSNKDLVDRVLIMLTADPINP
ncbi:MAG: hypothetical protein ACRDDY_14195 [Clostridium sp.]|uniref:hypothetical protein n=1 Tax=Clostridium sp. TaxID=1506 RepID=UPI003EE53881